MKPRVPTSDGHPRGGRAVAWIGFVFGSVISTAANVLYTWIPPVGVTADWRPDLTAQIGAAVWPLALLISVEVLSRVQWAPGWQWSLARYGGAGVVAVGSAVISYGHLHGVLDAWNYGPLASAVGPLVLDGLMTVSGFALLSPGQDASQDRSGDAREVLALHRVAAQDGRPAEAAQRSAVGTSAAMSGTADLAAQDAPSAPRHDVLPSDPGQSVEARAQDALDRTQDDQQDTEQDGPVNAETDPVRWAAFELEAGRSAGYVVLGRRFPDLSERQAKKAAKDAQDTRKRQDAGLHVVRAGGRTA